MNLILCILLILTLTPSRVLSEINQMRLEQRQLQIAHIQQNYKVNKHDLPEKTYKLSTRKLTGYAPHYSPGVMERVSRKRKLPLVACMVSSPYEKIGTWLEVKSLIDDDVLICRVTDVSANKDRPRHIKSRWAVELDFLSAKVLCNISRVGEMPARACPVQVTEIIG